MISRVVYYVVGFILMVTLLFSCGSPVKPAIYEETGVLWLSINIPASVQTVLPSLPVDEYVIHFSNGPQSHADVTVTGVTSNVELAIGTWDVSVEALNSISAVIATGGETDVVINADLTTEVSITLYPLTSGTGTVGVTANWPAEVAIDTVVCLVDGVSVDAPNLTVGGTSATYLSDKSAGNYVLEFILKSGTLVQAYIVEAVQVYGNVTSAATINLTINDFTTAPQAPTALSAITNLTQISLTWIDNSFVETSYILERSEGDNENYLVFEGALSPNTTSYNDTSVSTGTPYYYRVQARNEFGSSTYSNEICATKDIGNVVLQSPSNSSSIEDTTPLLTWSANGGASQYHLVVADNDQFDPTIIDSDTITVTDYQLSGVDQELLENGSAYYWMVAPIDGTGAQGAFSDISVFLIEMSVPDNLLPENNSFLDDTTPYLSWNQVVAAESYHLQLSASELFENCIVDIHDIPSSNYQIVQPIDYDLQYYWRVKIKNSDGVIGGWSEVNNFVINIGVPTLSYPAMATSISDTSPFLDWDDVPDANSYHVQVCISCDFDSSLVLNDSTVILSEYSTIPILENAQLYCWRVKIKNVDDVWGEWSEVNYFTTVVPVPTATVPLNGEKLIDTKPLLFWNANFDAASYQVQVSESPDFTPVLLDQNDLVDTYYQIATDLENSKKSYYWRVRNCNDDGVYSEWSVTSEFAIVDYWSKTYGRIGNDTANTILQIDSGGYLVFGRSDLGTLILKINGIGEIIWEKYYSTAVTAVFTSALEMSDGSIVLAGKIDQNRWDVIIARIDSTGSILWQYIYQEDYGDTAEAIVESPDGAVLIAGYNGTTGGMGWLAKIDTDGSIIWQKKYTCGSFNDITNAADGGYILASSRSNVGAGRSDLYVLKIDNTGSPEWGRAFGHGGSGYDSIAHSVKEVTGGDIVIAGETKVAIDIQSGYIDFWVLKLTSSGDLIWQHTFGGSNIEVAHSIVESPDLNYLVSGYTKSFGSGDRDFWAMKIDPNGSVLWQRTYGEGAIDESYCVQSTSDGGYIIAGKSGWLGSYDFSIFKLDADGTCPPYGIDSSVIPGEIQMTPESISAGALATDMIISTGDIVVTDTNVEIIQRSP